MAAEGMTMNTMDQPGAAPGPRAASSPFKARKTLIFANDKSSGKTTTANAVLVSLLQRYPMLMRGIDVREYERQPRLSLIFKKEDGFQSVLHRDARNGAAFDMARELAYDPNATPWDDLLYDIGIGNLIVDLGSNTFSEICRILDDEPRPIFPDGGDRVGVVVPVTTAADPEALPRWAPSCPPPSAPLPAGATAARPAARERPRRNGAGGGRPTGLGTGRF